VGFHPAVPTERPMTFLLFAGLFAGSLFLLLKDHNRNFKKY
jgi:hypothetical protein